MNNEDSDQYNEYIKAEDRIYDAATNKDLIDWKSFLYELIYKEGLNPWDIDLGVLTKKYLIALRDLKNVDFNISGKFLTVAIYLLKQKSEKLLENDIRGFEDEISNMQEQEEQFDEFDSLEDPLEYDNIEPEKKEYKLKFRNPIARKRKVNIFDLIKTLEKTFKQSNKRRANILLRQIEDVDYDGPIYEKKTKDLKQIIEELFENIIYKFETQKQDKIYFSNIITKNNTKLEVLDLFIPLLHLHNQTRIEVKQDAHFEDIQIYKLE